MCPAISALGTGLPNIYGKSMQNPPEAAVEYALDATDLVALLFFVVAGWQGGVLDETST